MEKRELIHLKDGCLILHHEGAPRLRSLGLGPRFVPVNAIKQVQTLLEDNTFWAKGRTQKQIRQMIKNGNAIVTIWKNYRLIGFGRGTSDSIFRAVLWDIVIASDYQKTGLGKILLRTLLESKSIKDVEKVYLMTTNCKMFYEENNFSEVTDQTLLVRYKQQDNA